MDSADAQPGHSRHYVIFTDLDDTLLDQDYRYDDAGPALRAVKEKSIPLIFCSAKTFAEQLVFLDEMGLKHPFIVEDGSAVYIPRNYFGEPRGKPAGDYEVVVLGVDYGEIKRQIQLLASKSRIRAYCTMSDEEVAEAMNLDLESARRAKDRQYSETVLEADDYALEALKERFNVRIGGKGIHVYGKGADKGKAVKLLTEMYAEGKDVTTVGLGNSYTDEPMLKAVDVPVLVRNPDGKWADIALENLYKEEGIGPEGWSKSIRKFVLGESDG